MKKRLNNRSEIIFVYLLGLYMAGIVVGYYLQGFLLKQTMLWLSGLLFVALFYLNIQYARLNIYKYKRYVALLLYSLVLCIGAWSCLASIEILSPTHFALQQSDFLKITITDEPQVKGTVQRFRATVNQSYRGQQGSKTMGHVMVTIYSKEALHEPYQYGDELLIKAAVKAVEPPQNPGEFDHKAWLAIKNIHHQVFITTSEVLMLQQQQGFSLQGMAFAIRKRQIDILQKYIKNPESFAVAATLILGYRSDLQQDTLAAYVKTGTIHVLSVSGMHVGLIYIVLNLLLGIMDSNRALKIAKAILIIVLIWCYALLTGFSPSVLRSAIMLSCYILAKTLHKRSNNYNVLAFSAFALLVYQPLFIFDVGFQLSYLSVLGLIFLQPVLYQKLEFEARWADQLWQVTCLSLAAQFATFPLSMYYFHQFPVYFLISNFFIMIPAALIMYVGFTMLILKFYILAPVLEFLISFTNAGLKYIAQLPLSTFTPLWFSRTELLLLTVLTLVIGLCLQTFNKQRLSLSLAVFLLFQISRNHQYLQVHQQRKTVVFKLKDHYAAVYLHARQAVLYTDVTPESRVFQYSIKPCLDLHGITRIQFIFKHSHLEKIKHL